MWIEYLISVNGFGGIYIEESDKALCTGHQVSECVWMVPGTISIDD